VAGTYFLRARTRHATGATLSEVWASVGASTYIDDVFLSAISLALSGWAAVACESNVAGLVSEGRYDIALRVTGQHWRASHALNLAPLPCNKGEEEKL
jgi:hypothetical protein